MSRQPRASEVIAKESLDGFLRANFPDSPLAWEWPDLDPPDWWLSFNGRRWAVEVRELEFQQASGFADRAAQHRARKLRFAIQERAKTLGILNGLYNLYVRPPLADLRDHEQHIFQVAIQYIGATQEVARASTRIISCGRGPKCSIEKVDCKPHKLEHSEPSDPWPPSAEWSGVAAESIAELIASAIAEKAEKCRNLPHPRMLILKNAYLHAGPDETPKDISSVDMVDEFDFVVVISDNRLALPVYPYNWHERLA